MKRKYPAGRRKQTLDLKCGLSHIGEPCEEATFLPQESHPTSMVERVRTAPLSIYNNTSQILPLSFSMQGKEH